jgi:hypothetical protein
MNSMAFISFKRRIKKERKKSQSKKSLKLTFIVSFERVYGPSINLEHDKTCSGDVLAEERGAEGEEGLEAVSVEGHEHVERRACFNKTNHGDDIGMLSSRGITEPQACTSFIIKTAFDDW